MVVNTITIKDEPSAETKALWLLKKWGYEFIQSPDWLAKKDGEWVVFEVKEKKLFKPGSNYPHWAAGLDKSQLYLRTQLFRELGIRTYLVVYDKETNDVYGAYLDDLEKGEYCDLPSGIRIYPLSNFKAIHDAPNQNLGGLM